MKNSTTDKLRRLGLTLFLAVVGIASLLVFHNRFTMSEAYAQATISVTTTTDVVDANGGDCSTLIVATLPGTDTLVSLREAICAANNTPGTDQINLPAGTYDLTITNTGIITENGNATGDLDIAESVNITGVGSATTIIDAGGASGLGDRIFHVLLGTNVQISNLTIRGGFAPSADSSTDGGGGIRNFGTLHLYNIIVSNNSSARNGAGIMNLRTLIMTDTLIANNTATVFGGGFANRGGAAVATLNRVVIDDNTAGSDGGGLWNNDELSLNEVTISNNDGDFGGGLYNETATVTLNRVTINNNVSTTGSGGGIRNQSAGVIRGTNVTISGNDATGTTSGVGGGIRNISAGSTVVLTNTTIASNVADSANGIQNDASMTLINSLVANGSSNCNTSGGTVTDGGNNLDSGTTCGFTQPSSLTNANPFLGPLQDNGGNTETHALLLGSRAVDGGSSSACPSTDQRGQARVNQAGVGSDTGTPCDLGAYEFTATVAAPALSIQDFSQNEGDAGTSTAVFTVTLNATIATTVTVDYATSDGTATAGSDYVAASDTLTFPPNTSGPSGAQSINVTVNGDMTGELNETFTVN
ncbi:MAG TPA: choice-of-anchor Q domain-containing protein, partial [Anaerolineae bacterium]